MLLWLVCKQHSNLFLINPKSTSYPICLYLFIFPKSPAWNPIWHLTSILGLFSSSISTRVTFRITVRMFIRLEDSTRLFPWRWSVKWDITASSKESPLSIPNVLLRPWHMAVADTITNQIYHLHYISQLVIWSSTRTGLVVSRIWD